MPRILLALFLSVTPAIPPEDARYCNGQEVRSGITTYYPNGQVVKSGSTTYYPNGQVVNSGTTYYYPNGQVVRSGSTYYTDTGVQTDRPPRRIAYKNEGWTLRFPVEGESVDVLAFSAELRSRDYLLSFELRAGEIADIEAECSR